MASEDVDAYLARLSEGPRAALEKVRAAVRAAAPDATEKIAYGMPTFRHGKRPLVGVAAFKDHCSFFPMSLEAMATHAKDLEPYDTTGTKGTIRFSPGKPLPASLIKKIVKTRIREIESR